MPIIFPYQYFNSSFGIIAYPSAALILKTIDGWRPFTFLFDTGAEVTIVSKLIANLVGLNLKEGEITSLFGVEGRPILGIKGNLQLRIGTQEIILPCLYSFKENTPLLLGRAGIFDRFNILFNNRKKQIELTPF